MKLLRAKIKLGLLNHLSSYDSKYVKRIYDLTYFWFRHNVNWVGQNDFLYDQSVDALANEAAKTDCDYLLINSLGHQIRERLFFSNLINFAEKNEFLVAGHILDQKEKYFGLHKQCLFLNINKYRDLGCPNFGFPRYNSEVSVQEAIRSKEDFHDGYTPHFLDAGTKKVEMFPDREGWNWISKSLESGLRVFNFNDEMRDQKYNLYPENNVEQFGSAMFKSGADQKSEDSAQQHYLDVHNLDATKERIFVFNSDEIDFKKATHEKLDHLFSVAAGFKPFLILHRNGFKRRTKVTYYDYSTNALKFRQFLVENWDGRNIKKAVQEFASLNGLSEWVFHSHFGYKENMEQIFIEFGGEQEWFQFWERYRKLDHAYEHINLFDEPEKLISMVADESQKTTYLWFSNSFYTETGILHMGLEGLRSKFDSFIQLLNENFPSVIVDGTDSDHVSYIGPLEHSPFFGPRGDSKNLYFKVTLSNSKNRTYDLYYRLKNNVSVKKWIYLMQQSEEARADIWGLSINIPMNKEEIQDILNQMMDCLTIINEEGEMRVQVPNLQFENITQEYLNRLHETFHSYEERARERGIEGVTRDCLHRINVLVHQTENGMLHMREPRALRFLNFSFFPQYNIPLDLEDYENFTMERQFGDLVMGYGTIGKNLFHCYWDNDLELVKKKMVRPQVMANPNVLSFFNAGRFTSKMEEGAYASFYKWCDENKVEKYGYDCRDPLHRGGHIRLGEFLNDVTSDEMIRVLKEYKNVKGFEFLWENDLYHVDNLIWKPVLPVIEVGKDRVFRFQPLKTQIGVIPNGGNDKRVGVNEAAAFEP